MSAERSVVLSFADTIKDEIVQSVLTNLQAMTDCLQSGDDSGLENIWEELCVQVQGEQSAFYSIYEDVVDSDIASNVSALPVYKRLALWLSTDAGLDWSTDQVEDDQPPINDQDIVEELRSLVLSKASDFENERIYNYIWHLDGDGEEGGEDGGVEDKEAEAKSIGDSESALPNGQVPMFADLRATSDEDMDADAARRSLSDDFGPDFITMIRAVAGQKAKEVVREILGQKT